MFILYDIIYIIYAIFYLPVLWFKRKRIYGLRNRFGFYSLELIQRLKNRKNIWLHAVSVGEVLSSAPLLPLLRNEFPQYNLIVSTTTPTGYLLAQKIVASQDSLIYFPFDLSWIIKRTVSILNPALFVTLEKEFWPNLVNKLNKCNIPIIVINGRMSHRSLAKYKKIQFLLKNIFNKISIFCMQTQADASRLRALGVNPAQIKITGNIKFDAVNNIGIDQGRKDKYYNYLMLDKKRLLLAGSTHAGEEEVIIDIYNKLLLSKKEWILLIAPRHLERLNKVEAAINNSGFRAVKISSLSKISRDNSYIYILDTMGELKTFYSLADLVFVGGSLVPFGGHNLIEPAYFSKPIIFGKYIFNFEDIAEQLISKQAAIKVADADDLAKNIENLVSNSYERQKLGQSAQEVVKLNAGAAKKNIEEVKKILIDEL